VKRIFDSVVFVLGVAIAGCGSGANKGGSGGGGSGSGGSGASPGTGGTGGVNGDAAVTGGSCSFTACGGNIVGTWHVASECGSFSPSSCPPSPGIVIEQEMSQATYTFGSNGSFTFVISGAFSETFRYPLACTGALADAGSAQSCAEFQSAVQASIAKGDAGSYGETFTCAMDVNQICVCTEAWTYPAPQTQTGTYLASGDQVTLTTSVDGGAGDAGAPASVAYCVSGNTLTLHLTGGGNVAGDLVMTLTK
jgi:hypothetical protein